MEEINLKELFSYYKSKILILILIVLITLFVCNVITLLFRVPKYKSNTTVVLVSKTSENYSYSSTEYQLNKNLVSTYSEIIKSRKVLNQVINNLGLSYTTDELSENITVEEVEDTEIIRINVIDEDSNLAMNITNEIAQVFIKEVKDIYNLENVSVVDEAVIAESPYNVNYLKDNVIYFAGGILLAFSIVFIMYYFDTSIKSTEVIEDKLHLTVLAIVPKESGV